MATVQELERAFLNAHNAGDKQAAQALAEALKSAMVSQPAAPAAPTAPKERTMLEAGKDILAGGVSGVGALAQLPGQVYGLATGDFSDTGLTKVGRELRETGESMKSAEFKRQEAERAAKIAEAGKKGELEAGITAFKETITNPSLLLNFLAEQAPNLIPGLAVARGLRIAGVGATGALTGAIGTGAVQQGADIGADTFKQMHKELTSKGMSNEEATGRVLGLAQAAGLSAAAISAGINALPFGRAIENAMAKVPVKGGKLTGMVKGGAGEAAAEMIEEGGGKVAQNVAMKQIKPEQSLTEGLGETMGMAAVGGLGLGTAAGLSRRGEVETLPLEEKPAVERQAPAAAAPQAPAAITPEAERQEQIRMEDELRARAEAPPVTEAEFVEGAPAPKLDEEEERRLAAMSEDKVTLEKEANKLKNRPERGSSLWSAMQGNLTPSDYAELGDKSFAGLKAPKGMGKSISELAADGSLNLWLPPNLQMTRGQDADLARMEGDELTKAKAADEYIKDRLRERNYLTWATNNRLEEIGTSLANIESSFKEIADVELANQLFQEAYNEQRAIDQEVEGIAPEGEDGSLEPPANVLEAIPEEPVEEEYFPDQDLLKEERISGKLSEQTSGLSDPKINTDNPGGRWLEEKKEYNNKEGLNEYGVPWKFGPVTANFKREVLIPVELLEKIPGMRGEQSNVREKDLASIKDYMEKKNKLPPFNPKNEDEHYYPFIQVNQDGNPYVNEGNHRIMAARDLGYKYLPVELRYFTGGEEIDGLFSPNKILEYDRKARSEGYNLINYGELAKGATAEQAKFVINKDPEHQRIEKELTGKSMQQVAQWAVDNAPNQFAKVIAQKVMNRINGMAKRGIKMEFEIATGERRPTRMYSARGLVDFDFGRPGEGKQPTFKMTINGAAVMDNQGGYPPGARYITVLHELLHVATVGQTNILKGNDPIVKDLRDLFNKVVEHFNTEVRAGRITPFMQRMYSREINALTTPDELLAWGISDQGMQKFLSEIKVGEQTMMDKLVELIRKILNVTKPYLTALDQLVKTTESILDEDVNVVGDKIIAKQYSFGVAPGQGEAVQGTLFQKEEKQTPVQKAKATAQKALQKRTLPKSQFEGVDDDYYAALQPVFAPEKKTIIDKIEGMQNDFWKKLAQGVADQYRSIKDISEDAYMKARMSKTVDGALEGILFNGHVKLTDGALDIAKGTKGLFKVLEPVGQEVDRYQIWVALTRDAELVREGKAPSVSKDIVARRNELASGKIGDKSRLDVYKEVQRDMKKLNGSVLSVALRQGIIDKEAYKVYRRDINYIPFYKMMDENSDVQSVATKSGLVNQYFSKELKGGQKYFGDLMENTLRNWSHILSASMKNEAANATIRAALDLDAAFPNLKVGLDWQDGKVYSAKTGQLVGDGKLKPEYTTSGKGTIKTMINGVPAYFDVKEPLLLESIMSIGYMGPKSKFLDVARNFKNMLQFGVTLSPAFKIRNLFRDSISAMAVTDLKKNPFANVINNWAATDKNNPAHISALAGGAIFNFGSVYEGDQAKLIKRLLDSGVRGDTILDNEKKIKAGLQKAWSKYQEYGNKSEAANRMALYNQLKEQGLSHLEASFQARDMLDFSMQGSWSTFRYLTQIVPFLNARVQGLYKLGRDGIIPTSRVVYNTVTGKPDESTTSDKKRAAQFSIVMGAVALASLALYLAFKDDEEFKKREQWDRDNFWWFKLPGMEAALRVPKPFEIGALGTVAERVAEQIMDQGVEGKVFGQSLSRMLFDTFAINPTPQVFKPLVDLYSNKDSFTGAPIETAGMERLSKAERIAERTSPLAIGLSKVSNVFLPESMEVSPVQTDYTIKAYLGWLGGTISATSHYAVQPFSKSAYPDANWTETMSMGFIKSLPATQSKYVTAFYENNKEISQAYADMRHFAQLGQADKVQEILKEKGDKIAMAKFYDNASKDMSKMRQAIQAIRNDENMSGAQKKEEIDRMKIIIGEIAKQMEDARIMIKKQYAASQ